MAKIENIGVYIICGAEFEKETTRYEYCSRRCAGISANRASRARARGEILERGTDCPHNSALICKEHRCETCGWNPKVAKRRLAML